MRRPFNLLAAFAVVSATGLQFAAAQAPKPSPEHARLGYFVGKWTAEGEMKPGPMGPGGKMTSSDNCEWFEGRFSVICRSEGTTPMGPTKSIGILSYSPEEKVYTYYGVDNSNMTMASVPRGTLRGDTWTYTRRRHDGRPEGQIAGDDQGAPTQVVQLQDGDTGTGREVDADDGDQEHKNAVVGRSNDEVGDIAAAPGVLSGRRFDRLFRWS